MTTIIIIICIPIALAFIFIGSYIQELLTIEE